jgi:hypothetical protein
MMPLGVGKRMKKVWGRLVGYRPSNEGVRFGRGVSSWLKLFFEMHVLSISKAIQHFEQNWRYRGLPNVCPASPILPDLAKGLALQSCLYCKGSF